ncbi:MAG: type I restriction endonuclease [Acidimicrobiaceae bacterium]|uniref:type I restriction endonuclease n=1 Tax=Candidatus Poriferisodalis multihospitum TaxID=2983191 RepID=UPI00239288F9|nr:hypothetical protein [Candidatus Poriferisodalis multihospitum]MDE0497100.1 type I restriction endonuclease [Acidimicrobiaceae bacterium]
MSSSGLEEALTKARATLASGVLANEAMVQASVIRPILRELGWDDADPRQWQVEYPVDGKRVDEALLGPLGKPLVFIEAKRQGNLNVKAEEQLFRYAAHKGVPILVLTDGDTWDLYLSMAAGEPAERRFAPLTLTESDDLGRVAQDLREFMARDAVLSGRGHDAAQARLKQVKDRAIGKSGLESAWAELLREPDDMLRDLLVEKVEQRIGSRPWAQDVDEFLSALADRLDAPAAPSNQYEDPVSSEQVPSWSTAGQDSAVVAGRIVGVVIRGNRHEVGNGQAAMALLAGAMQRQSPDFLERYRDEAAPGAHKRPPAVRDDALNDYLEGQIRGQSYRQVDGSSEWWIYVNLKTNAQARRMRMMAKIAGLSWGTDEGVRLIHGAAG